MYQTEDIDKIETHILCSAIPPPPEIRAVYEIMWKNVVEPETP